MEDTLVSPSKPAATPEESKSDAPVYTMEELSKVLTLKQKRALGIAVTKQRTPAEQKRLEALRDRMIALNQKRKEEKAAKAEPVKAAPPAPVKQKRKKAPEPSESSIDSSSDEYIQKKAKKVNKTLNQLSKMDEYMHQLRQQHSHNPFFNLMMR